MSLTNILLSLHTVLIPYDVIVICFVTLSLEKILRQQGTWNVWYFKNYKFLLEKWLHIWNEPRDILKTILIKKKKSAPLKLRVFYRSLKLHTLVFGSVAVQRPQCDLLSVVDERPFHFRSSMPAGVCTHSILQWSLGAGSLSVLALLSSCLVRSSPTSLLLLSILLTTSPAFMPLLSPSNERCIS